MGGIKATEAVAGDDRIATGRRPAPVGATSKTTRGGCADQLGPIRKNGQRSRTGGKTADHPAAQPVRRPSWRPNPHTDPGRPSSSWPQAHQSGHRARTALLCRGPVRRGPIKPVGVQIYLECRKRRRRVAAGRNHRWRESGLRTVPLGPSNPLATALRAAARVHAVQREFDPQAGEPYPHACWFGPRGINAYYAARAAMKSWDSTSATNWSATTGSSPTHRRIRRLVELLRTSDRLVRGQVRPRLIAAAPRHYDTGTKGGVSGITHRAGGFLRDGGFRR